MSEDLNKIRNFSIISHVDAGKSTLADRLLELTATIPKEKMRPQYLDQLSLERERGITIKLQPVTMKWQGYTLNLIDTPGHVDFSYEVSRSLAATEGALLLVDARNGLEAQTVANFYLARALQLKIIPIVNKIDLPDVDVNLRKKELVDFVGVALDEVLCVSAKYGEGVEKILEEIIKKIPPPGTVQYLAPPTGDRSKILRSPDEGQKPFRALIFDSFFDEYRGVIIYVRVIEGKIKLSEKIKFFNNKITADVEDIGIFTPELKSSGELMSGQIGYLATGLKEIKLARIGETIFLEKDEKIGKIIEPLKGFSPPQPMVFAGFYPRSGDDFEKFKKALEKIALNDPSIDLRPEHLKSLGFGFRLGFLGPLHLEIISERLKREYQIELIITPPTTEYRLTLEQDKTMLIRSPHEFPEGKIKKVEERLVKINIMVTKEHFGKVTKFLENFSAENRDRFIFGRIDYLGSSCLIEFQIPLSLLIQNFYDKLKSASHGFASYSYELGEFCEVEVNKLDILIADKKIEQLSILVYKDKAYERARNLLLKLKEVLPPQLFEVKLQAAIGGKIVAAERISARRKDVTAPLYGGDVTRKKKLLAKQKKGKKKMARKGEVSIPMEVYRELYR